MKHSEYRMLVCCHHSDSMKYQQHTQHHSRHHINKAYHDDPWLNPRSSTVSSMSRSLPGKNLLRLPFGMVSCWIDEVSLRTNCNGFVFVRWMVSDAMLDMRCNNNEIWDLLIQLFYERSVRCGCSLGRWQVKVRGSVRWWRWCENVGRTRCRLSVMRRR